MSFSQRMRQAVSRRALRSRAVVRLVHRTRGLPGLAGLLARSVDARGRQEGRVTCLCLLRRGFSRDVEVLRQRASDVNWIGLRNEDLARVQRLWSPARFMKKASYPRYRELHTGEAAAARERNAELARLLLARLSTNGLPVHAVLAANFDYWQDEGLKAVCPEEGVPFLVLNREHVMTDEATRNYAGHYRRAIAEGFVFQADAMAVFGPRTKDAVVAAGLAAADRVVVTGAPRADYLREIAWSPQRADTVLLMSFALPAYQAVDEFEQTLRTLSDVAAGSPRDVRFVVWCKDKTDLATVRRMKPHGRIELLTDRKAGYAETLARARAVMGYGSLSLFEACFTEAPVLVPHWGATGQDALYPVTNPDDPRHARVFEFVEGSDRLAQRLTAVVSHPPSALPSDQRQVRDEVVRSIFALPEDGACAAVARFVKSHARTRV